MNKEIRKNISAFYRSSTKGIVKQFDNSTILKFIWSLKRIILGLKSRAVGSFFLGIGIYTAIKSLFQYFVYGISFDYSLYFGVLVFLVFLPLLFSDNNISFLLINSKLGNCIINCLGFREEDVQTEKKYGISALFFIFGALLGFFSSITSILIIFSIIVILVVIDCPLAGYYISIISICFPLPEKIVVCILSLSLFSILFRIVRLKMVLKINTMVNSMLALSIMLLVLCIMGLMDIKYVLISLLCTLMPSVLNKAKYINLLFNFITLMITFLCSYKLILFLFSSFPVFDRIYTLKIDALSNYFFSQSQLLMVIFAIAMILNQIIGEKKGGRKIASIIKLIIVGSSVYFCGELIPNIYTSVLFNILTSRSYLFLIAYIAIIIVICIKSLQTHIYSEKIKDVSNVSYLKYKEFNYWNHIISFLILSLIFVVLCSLFSNAKDVVVIYYLVMGLYVSDSTIYKSSIKKVEGAFNDGQNDTIYSMDII